MKVFNGKEYEEVDIPVLADALKRIDELERTVAGLQVLLGKAAEYKARPKRERLPR